VLSLWQRLADAQTFIEVATHVCVGASALYGLDQLCMSLHAADGKPVLAVDSVPNIADDQRRAWFEAASHHRHVDDATVVPLVEPRGVFGVMACVRREPLTNIERAALSLLGAQISVRLAQLGITTRSAEADLSPRQHAIADLASRGFSNGEVASALAISANTVKKQLKEVYRRLDVANRTELARVLPRLAVTDAEAPVGVTRAGAVTITRPC
jgi:DNA-binding CsgD family transcriptional regulator